MAMNMRTKRLGIGGLVAGGLTLGAAGLAAGVGIAKAETSDDMAYLGALKSSGIVIYDPVGAVARGHQICSMMVGQSGEAAAQSLYALTTNVETPTLNVARVMVVDAANTLCPWAWGNSAGGNQIV